MVFARKLKNVLFVVLFVGTFGIYADNAGAAVLPDSPEEATPLKAGDRAPAFTVRTVENEAFHFDPASLQKPVVLISFRGGWCPYCNMHLSELRKVIPDMRELGFDVLFLSLDRPEILYSGLKEQTQKDIEGIDYTILSDSDLEAAVAFGTAFRSSKMLIEYLDKVGKDYAGSSIDKLGAQTIPAVFIIDKNGRIVFDHVNADYKIRIPADELLAAARAAQGT